MADNKKIAEEVLKAIGGSGNITSATHCITRLRFTLKDMSIPEQNNIKEIDGVIGTNIAGNQYQVIIGQNVTKVYDEFCKVAGLENKDVIKENLDVSKEPLTLKLVGKKTLEYLSGSMVPLIPAMIGAAMFKTLQVVFGPGMLNLVSEASDFYLLCNFIYYGFFYFIPIFLGYTASKKVGLNPVLGMLAAGMLLAPDFVALAEAGQSFSVYGIPSLAQDYGQSILPILMIVPVVNIVYNFFKKYIPDMLSTVFAPFLTLVVVAPIAFCALAPLGNYLGTLLGNVLVSFAGVGGFIAVAIVAALWEFLVMTGMHQLLIVFGITSMIQNGVDTFVLTAAGNATWAAFGMALGAFLKIKNKKEKSLSLGYFISGLLGGVTEPVLYGIGFKYKKPFIAMAIGGFVGGLYAGLTHVGTYVMGATNFLSVLGFIGGGTSNFVNGVIANLLAMIVSAVLTFMFGFKKEDIN